MAIAAMTIHPDVQEKLGQPLVQEIALNLWPQDCQTCNQPLGTQPPSLCVDDFGPFANASLHHTDCRTSAWIEIHTVQAVDTLSWRARFGIWPLTKGDEPDPRPLFVVNPHLEAVHLNNGPTGWYVNTIEHWRGNGLRPAGPELRLDRPVKPEGGIAPVARLHGPTVHVDFGPYGQWSSSGDPQVISRTRELDGLLLAVSTRIHPQNIASPHDLVGPATAGHVAFGWIPLAR